MGGKHKGAICEDQGTGDTVACEWSTGWAFAADGRAARDGGEDEGERRATPTPYLRTRRCFSASSLFLGLREFPSAYNPAKFPGARCFVQPRRNPGRRERPCHSVLEIEDADRGNSLTDLRTDVTGSRAYDVSAHCFCSFFVLRRRHLRPLPVLRDFLRAASSRHQHMSEDDQRARAWALIF